MEKIYRKDQMAPFQPRTFNPNIITKEIVQITPWCPYRGDSKLSFTKLYTAQVFDPSLFNVLKSSLKTGWRVVLYGAWNEWQGTLNL